MCWITIQVIIPVLRIGLKILCDERVSSIINTTRFFLVNGMQTPPSPTSKMAKLGYQNMRNILKPISSKSGKIVGKKMSKNCLRVGGSVP